jgi:spore coat protein U-like protein
MRIAAVTAAISLLVLQPHVGRAATVSTTVGMSSTVVATCTVTAAPLAFGTYSSVQIDQTTTITVNCSNGAAYTIGLGAGTAPGATVTTRRMVNGGSTMNYSLFRDAARTLNWGTTIGTNTVAGTGSGADQAVIIYGRIPGAQSVPSGSYADTVAITVTY